MAVPDFQTLMLPLLKLAIDGQRHTLAEAIEQLALEFQLSDDDRTQLLGSGQTCLYNRGRLDDDIPQESRPPPGSWTGTLPTDGPWAGRSCWPPRGHRRCFPGEVPGVLGVPKGPFKTRSRG